MMETQALIAATAVMAVLMGLAGWFDLKALRIPNWCVLAVVALYVVTGLWGLPLDIFAWRFLHGVIVLFLGFGLYSISGGQVGGGDIKLIAALTPFIAGSDILFVLGVFAILSLVGLMIHRLVRRLLRERKTGWAALDQKQFFPAGLLLGGTIMIYLGSQLAGRYTG
jgi:prepilin peptidase CpaA